jgi:hypothetical protein
LPTAIFRPGDALTNSAHFFFKFGEIRRIQVGPNLKITEFTIYHFKFSEKIKISKKICKKTRLNSKVTGEEIFIKPSRLG